MTRWIRNSTVSLGLAVNIMTADAATGRFYQEHLAPGVNIGMTVKELQTARPSAFSNELGQPGDARNGRVQMMEIRRGRSAASSYLFEAGKLGAVTESTSTTGIPIEHTRAVADKLAEELKANFEFVGRHEILRAPDAVAVVLTAELWQDKEKGLNVYFVATSQEITVVVFDPKGFGKDDFFLGRERLKQVEANNARIRQMLGPRIATPVPVINLLVERTDEKPVPTTTANTQPSKTPASPAADSPLRVRNSPVGQPASTAGDHRRSPWLWIGCGFAALLVGFLVVLKRRLKKP